MIEIGVLEGPKQAICELISNDWRQVGIEGACKLVDGALQSERLDNNETAITAWHLGRTTLLGRGTPDQFAFERCGANNWGRQWCFWFVSGGDSGIEPPDEIKALNDSGRRSSRPPPAPPRRSSWARRTSPTLPTSCR